MIKTTYRATVGKAGKLWVYSIRLGAEYEILNTEAIISKSAMPK